MLDSKLTEHQRFTFGGDPFQIFFDPHRNSLFINDSKTQELVIAAKESGEWKVNKLERKQTVRLHIESFTVTDSETLVLWDDKSETLQIHKME